MSYLLKDLQEIQHKCQSSIDLKKKCAFEGNNHVMAMTSLSDFDLLEILHYAVIGYQTEHPK